MTDSLLPAGYTPARLRITATYGVTSGEQPETVDIEIHDESQPVTAKYVSELLDALLCNGPRGGTLTFDFADTTTTTSTQGLQSVASALRTEEAVRKSNGQ